MRKTEVKNRVAKYLVPEDELYEESQNQVTDGAIVPVAVTLGWAQWP